MRNERSRDQVNTQKSTVASRVPDRRVGERLEAVGQHVARDRRVERPQEDGAEQHQVDGPHAHRPQ